MAMYHGLGAIGRYKQSYWDKYVAIVSIQKVKVLVILNIVAIGEGQRRREKKSTNIESKYNSTYHIKKKV